MFSRKKNDRDKIFAIIQEYNMHKFMSVMQICSNANELLNSLLNFLSWICNDKSWLNPCTTPLAINSCSNYWNLQCKYLIRFLKFFTAQIFFIILHSSVPTYCCCWHQQHHSIPLKTSKHKWLLEQFWPNWGPEAAIYRNVRIHGSPSHLAEPSMSL